MEEWKKKLSESLQGDIYYDEVTCTVYSVDASIFELKPSAVVLPKSKLDLLQIVKIAREYNIPLTARGAATGITGACLGHGIIVDLSTYMDQIIEINIDQGYAICEPGVVQDRLNEQLSSYNYRLGPDTSTGNRATLGGMTANNSAGARSLKFGKMVDHVQEVEILLANGEFITFGQMTEEKWKEKRALKSTEGQIYQAVWEIKTKYEKEIQQNFPNIPRRATGYNLDELLKKNGANVAKLIVGSEGTLGIITSIRLRIVPKPQALGLCLITFTDILEAFQFVPDILKFHPTAVELIDDQIIELGRASPSLRGQLDWLEGNPKGILIIELEASNQNELKEKLETFSAKMRENQIGVAQYNLTDPIKISHVWALRKSGLGVLLSKRTYSRAIAFIEDVTIDPYRLEPFMKEFCKYLSKKRKKGWYLWSCRIWLHAYSSLHQLAKPRRI